MKSITSGRSIPIGAMLIMLFAGGLSAAVQAQNKKAGDDACCAKSAGEKHATKPGRIIPSRPMVCKLTSKELQERKATVIAALKKEMLERKELPNGYSFTFRGDDESIDRLIAFVKAERQCCGFFTFNLSVTEDYARLELTGPEGAKEFVTSEIGL